ncbi:MAG: acyltransferase [Bacteroidales bacterium]|jgi:acetyltransferase-like isoleucine patch superfamily enzyme
MKDISGFFFKFYDNGLLRLKTIFCSAFLRLSCCLRGIDIGKNIYSFGHTTFRRFPNSTISISDNCVFRSSVTSNLIGNNRKCILSTLLAGSKIIIGKRCGFSGTIIGAFKSIEIGNNVRCGANTLITDGDWHFDDPRSGEPKEIIIERNVWIGEGVKILKGVTIGENTIIGTGSVVTRNIPPNVVAAGNPCKVIRPL